MRPKQWIKSLFCFLPLFFSGKLFTVDLCDVILIAVIMSLVSSCAYIYNDYHNIAQDREHDKKKHRPLASGLVSKRESLILFFVIAIVVAILLKFTSHEKEAAIGIFVYCAVQFFYTNIFRSIAYLDVLIVSTGFLVRLYLGGVIVESGVSIWLYLSVYFLALNLFIYKRLSEYSKLKEKANKTRNIWSESSSRYYELMSVASFTILMLVYVAYIFLEKNNIYGWATALISLYIVVRYVRSDGHHFDKERPYSVLFKDKVILVCAMMWLSLHFMIIYWS